MRRSLFVFLALALMAAPAGAQQITCQQSATVTVAAATDTQVVAALPNTNIYICDYEFSSNGTNNAFLETAATGNCGGTKIQITNTWYTVANNGKAAANATYRGLNTGGRQLCLNTSTGTTFSITVYFSQQP